MNETASKTVTTKVELNYSKNFGDTIPAGTELTVNWSARRPNALTFQWKGTNRAIRIFSIGKKLTGFINQPSFATLEKWNNDGIVKSLTGKKVEPDGFGPDGFPSWMIVLGII